MLTEPLWATHNRAGEITYRQINALQYEFTLTTFTDISGPSPVDRPTALINFGDGTSSEQPRVVKELISGTFIQRNKYLFNHTFPGYATYTISYQDPNRNNSVQNMANSVNTPFYVETELVINPFIGFNSSPVLLLEPIDFGGLNKLFVHNPNAYDVDGDSLSFKLVACKQAVGEEVFDFRFPDRQNGFATDTFYIEEETGQLIWRNPSQIGLYNIAIQIEEWRYVKNSNRYVRIGYVIRDMQIEIFPTNNNPPVIRPLVDTCIIAGTILTKNIIADDPDNNVLTLTATGGPFKLPPPDTVRFIQPNVATGTVSQTFSWTTSCNSVRKRPYQLVFKAVDDGTPSPKLVDLETWRITIIAPAPQNLASSTSGTSINLTWDGSNTCSKARGYKIYRKIEPALFNPSACETGVPAYTGYRLIQTIDDINASSFRDNNNGQGLHIGVNYCYRIISYFDDGSESISSNETCQRLSRDLPVLTHVSVNNTSTASGSDTVRWSKPTELDTLQYSGPYEYRLMRASGNNQAFNLIQTYTSTFLGNLNDSIYRDENQNTQDLQYTYRVDLYAASALVGYYSPASSVFLKTEPLDNKVALSWDVRVPWANDSFQVYRYDPVSAGFIQIGTSTTLSYTDTGLTNGANYCYYIKSFGKYPTDTTNIFINNSQEACETPVDLEPPCPPQLTVVPGCTTYTNELSWTNPATDCPDDILRYKIYKTAFEGGDFSLLAEVSPGNVLHYSDQQLFRSIAGCYFITAIDSFNNESEKSNVVCVDNCPKLGLPNVFTPNGDGINDHFTPVRDSIDFIDQVNVQIFNRWGKLVFETQNPAIMWDGTDKDTKQPLPSGVYFYVYEFSEIRVVGLKPKSITGSIHLLR